MVGRRIVYFLALVGSVLFYLIYQQWFSWILLLVVVIFPLLSLALSIYPMMNLRMGLDVPVKLPLGKKEKANLKVTSKLPLPPYKGKILLTKPLTGERWKLKSGAKLPSEHCGRLYAELYKPGVYDYLGIFGWKIKKKDKQTILILPEPIEMPVPPSLYKHLEPHWLKKPGGGYAENHEIRQYQPGDNMNQIHWKLSAKVGELMLREPMMPERGLMLLTMDLNGTAEELDTKLGQLLWLSRWMQAREIVFEIRVLTANGVKSWTIRSEEDIDRCILSLLETSPARDGSLRDIFIKATWRHHIGGEQDEA